MKQIKKVVLKEATKLSQEEMKFVFGGSGSSTDTSGVSPKVKACEGKKKGDSCFWYTSSGSRSYGTCQCWWGSTLHCSDLNQKPFQP